ncbi:MAG TPA: hypothetical protein VG871_02015 [Vicinamibacterales bacterium]|nr:hypothetical protein [Vicinamibacterales bacterium]
MSRRLLSTVGLIALLGAVAPYAQRAFTVADVANGLTFRNIGPFRTAAWVTSVAVPESPARDHLYTIYAGSRSGGVWKTTNSGVTWTNVTDSVGLTSIGAVALAPSDPNVVWVGTGDQANARSSYSGKGLFKSTDAGKTWTFAGLPDSQHIARIVIHPTKPDVVYVAALGHLFSRNEERGVFRTLDGGRTWKKVLYVNDRVGAVDIVVNRRNPRMLYAAMYDKERRPWELVESGPGSGVFETTDGGDTWQRLGGGLPTGKIGRIGLDIYQRNPSILYALVENQNPKAGAKQGEVTALSPLASGIIGNELYRTDDGGKTWRKVTEENVAGGKAPYSFNQIRIDPHDDRTVIVTSDSMYISRDGGRTWNTDFFRGMFGDFRCMWWDPDDKDRIILGSDGGVSISYDGGKTADYFPNMGVGEVYAVAVDMEDPYNVYGGMQDHDSWKGPSNGRTGVISLEDWVTVGPGDGMYNLVDPTNSRWAYNTRELNQMGRMDQLTGVRTNIAPKRPAGEPRLRYNWIAPIAMSPFNPEIIYAGAQVLFQSLDRGNTWQEISPDLTTNDPSKIGRNVPFCTITTISESPVTPGLIWVGTDDGKVQLTRNRGGNWTDLTQAVAAAGGPADRWVTRVFASPHDAGTAFVAKSGFHDDDFHSYLYRTTDYGQTWTSIAGNLPNAPINVVVQDRKSANLLFVGNDLGVFVSIDGGRAWTQMKAGLPTVPVQDLTIHPRENDLVLGTYGRAFWVGDITPLQELTPDVLNHAPYLFDIEPRARYGFSDQGMNYHLFGDKYLQVPNEPDALVVNYLLPADPKAPVHVRLTDAHGHTLRDVTATAKAGFNQTLVPLNGRRGRGDQAAAQPIDVGTYTVTLVVDGQTLTKPGRVRPRLQLKAPM